jgi:nicotinamidase-related amidase
MSKMALLIIDMLDDFFRQQARLAEQRTHLVASISTLGEAFRHHGQPVLWVRQAFAPNLHDAFLEMRKHDLHVTIARTDCNL